MSRIVFESEEFLVEDSEGVGFFVVGNSDYDLGRRFTEKTTGHVFYLDRIKLRVLEHKTDGSLAHVTDRATVERLDLQKRKR